MISFLIQGPVTKVTELTVNSINRYYPNSEIIISSTNNKTVDGVKTFFIEEQSDNWNYHIESSRMIKFASNDIVCKLRSDIVFISNNLVINDNNRTESHKLFSSRITCCNYHFCDPVITSMNYHPSDWLFFGRKEDIIQLFEIPKYIRTEVYCNKNFVTKRNEPISPGFRVKTRPEQHFFISALNNAGHKIDIKFDYDNSDTDNGIKWLINNFYILDAGKMSGFYCTKYPYCINKNYGYINNDDWNNYSQKIAQGLI